jgi:hypothetical protein
MRIRPIAFCLGVSAASCFALTAHADAGYKVTVLQHPGGQANSSPFFRAINNFGQSVGSSATASGGVEGVLWSRTGRATVLQDVGGEDNSSASAINAFGWSVGSSGAASGLEAVLWSPTGKGRALQTPSGLTSSQGAAINSAGWSVGTGSASNGDDAALLWSPSGRATVLRNAGGFRGPILHLRPGWLSRRAVVPDRATDGASGRRRGLRRRWFDQQPRMDRGNLFFR